MSKFFKLCPKCGEKQIYSTKYVRDISLKNNTLCNICAGLKRRIEIPEKGWIKKCPICGKNQKYSCKSIYTLSVKESRMCLKCLGKRKQKHNGIFQRFCDKCGKKLNDSCRQSLNISKKHNSMCRNCATKESAKYIDRSFQKTDEYKNMMSISCTGKKHTEETKEKLRIAKLKQIKEKGTKINFNPIACQFIDDFGKQNGYNFRHALNGGEKVVSGYSLDGYDEEKNVVFEYDEPKHNILSINKRDKIREQRIINKLNPILFIRYNEKYNKLYDVISGKELL